MLVTFHDLAIELMLIHVSTQQSQTVQMTKLHFYSTKQNVQKWRTLIKTKSVKLNLYQI